MRKNAPEFSMMPKPNLCGNAGENVPGEHEIRYFEYMEKVRECVKGDFESGISKI